MSRISKNGLRELVARALTQQEPVIDLGKGYPSAQIQALGMMAQGKKQAFQAVWDALNGDTVLLKIEAGV